jgi:dihydroneopterin aldolase
MTDTRITPAFGQLDSRVDAMAHEAPLDRISLRDHMVEVEIGAFQSERGTTQRLSFNVVVEVLPSDGAATDDVDRILSYDTITNAIAHEFAAERLNLLETLAERVAQRMLGEPQAARVFVRIEKLDRGPGALGVEIVRTGTKGVVAQTSTDTAVAPLVVSLSQRAAASPHLVGWLDQLQSLNAPVLIVVCTEPPSLRVNHKPVQKRIDLLEMEQAAWVLAAQDDRCVVMGSRTELHHAIQTGMFAVWAPSKIVLDAVEKPAFDISDTAHLTAWFAKEFGARGVLRIDDENGQTADSEILDMESFLT